LTNILYWNIIYSNKEYLLLTCNLLLSYIQIAESASQTGTPLAATCEGAEARHGSRKHQAWLKNKKGHFACKMSAVPKHI
jgi:hypothetical protein